MSAMERRDILSAALRELHAITAEYRPDCEPYSEAFAAIDHLENVLLYLAVRPSPQPTRVVPDDQRRER